MKMNKFGAAAALVALAATTTLLPLAAHADSQQGNKNNWRNLGIGSAVVGGYGLLHHNTTLGVLGVAGAAYSAHRYEEDRHSQSQANARRNYYRTHRYYHRYNRYNHG